MAKTDFDELMCIGMDIGKDTLHLVGLELLQLRPHGMFDGFLSYRLPYISVRVSRVRAAIEYLDATCPYGNIR